MTEVYPTCPFAAFAACQGSTCALWTWSPVQIRGAEVHLGSCSMGTTGSACSFPDPSGRVSGDCYYQDEHARRIYGKPNQAPKPMKKQDNARVYFIQAGEDGPIKIGTSKNPLARMKSLQSATAETLVLLGTIKGGHQVERKWHNDHKTHRISGEWFHPHSDLLNAMLVAGVMVTT